MRSNIAASVTIASLLALAGCSRFDSSKSAGNSEDTTSRSVATAVVDTSATVTAEGFGALRIGMDVTNAATALRSPVPSTVGLDTACSLVNFTNAPIGMQLMVVRGIVARIEIDSSSIATGLGARVGDSEARIRDLYGSRVTVQPSKYVANGHYLIVNGTPASDSGFKLLFETDGSRVTRYRAGRMPEVEWVEGCA